MTKVLIVHDSDEHRDYVQWLEAMRYHVTEHELQAPMTSGPPYDIVILMLSMLARSGIVRFFDAFKPDSKKIVVFARYSTPQDAELAYDSGATHFLMRSNVPRQHFEYIIKQLVDR